MIEATTERMIMKTNITISNGKFDFSVSHNKPIDLLNLSYHVLEEGAFVFYDKKQPSKRVCHISLTNHRQKVELKYETEDSYKNQGFMTEALQFLVLWIHKNTSEPELWLLIDDTNRPSLRVAQKAGFEKQSSTEKWYLKAIKY